MSLELQGDSQGTCSTLTWLPEVPNGRARAQAFYLVHAGFSLTSGSHSVHPDSLGRTKAPGQMSSMGFWEVRVVFLSLLDLLNDFCQQSCLGFSSSLIKPAISPVLQPSFPASQQEVLPSSCFIIDTLIFSLRSSLWGSWASLHYRRDAVKWEQHRARFQATPVSQCSAHTAVYLKADAPSLVWARALLRGCFHLFSTCTLLAFPWATK